MTGTITDIHATGGRWEAYLTAMDKDPGATPDGSAVWLESGEQGTIRVADTGHPRYVADFGPAPTPAKKSDRPSGRKWTTSADAARRWFVNAAKDAAPSRLVLSSTTWKTRIGPLVDKADKATTPQEAIAAYNEIAKERRELSIPSEVARRLVPLEDLRQLGKLVQENPETRAKVQEQFKRDYQEAGKVASQVLEPVTDGASALWDSIPTWGKAALIGGAALLVIDRVR